MLHSGQRFFELTESTMGHRSSFWACLLLGVLLAACGADTEGEAGDVEAARPERAPAVEAAAASGGGEERPDGPDQGAAREVLEREFVYGAARDRNLVGRFFAPDDIIEPLPAVVLVHDWWGLNDTVRDAARRVAAEGYAVLAVDLYGGSVATTAAEADALMSAVIGDRQGTLDNLRQAYDYLEQYALAPRIAAIGWHLGGTWALESALESGDRLDAVVIYYGQVVTDEGRLKRLDMPLLGIFAENDEVVPLRTVTSFRNSLRDLHKRADVYVYSDVGHGFADPARPGYAAAAAEEAWEMTLSFLDAELRGGARSPKSR